MVKLDNYTQAEIDFADVELRSQIERTRRTEMLHETDWWAVQDRVMSQEELDYRQALRDVPEQTGFPTNITWPDKP